MKISVLVTGIVLIISVQLGALTFTVSNTSDSAVLPGSLRWAMIQANLNGGPDQIDFNIGGGGFQSITPMSQLPPLTDPAGVIIDGLTQPVASAGLNPPFTATLLIEINGSFAGMAHGIWLQSDANTVQGLIINQFWGDGIRIEGGPANSTADLNVLYCNFIGTDASGTIDMGNGTSMVGFSGGVHVCNTPGGQSMYNTVDGSLISGNYAEGVWLEGPHQPGDVGLHRVINNYIGTDISGTVDLGNDHEGVAMTEGTHDNEVIGNLISGNDYDGVGMQGFSNIPFTPIQTSHNIVAYNIIGLDIKMSPANPLSNSMHGVAIGEYGPSQWGCADFNTVDHNIIAYNGRDGVAVWEDSVNPFNGDHNKISQNSIYSNSQLGIDLNSDNVTLNDVGDPDWRANQEVNFPVITGITYTAGVTVITGILDSPNPDLCTIEVFLARPDGTGYGEGEWYLGSVAPDGAGNWIFSTILLVPGDSVTATTTDAANNTSEFCKYMQISGAPRLVSKLRTIPQSVGGSINFSLTASPFNANRGYILLGGISGIFPGTPLPGGLATLPLNWDLFTGFVFNFINSAIFTNFLGQLDAAGNATAQLNVPPVPGLTGLVMYYSFALSNPWNFVSNQVAIQITVW